MKTGQGGGIAFVLFLICSASSAYSYAVGAIPLQETVQAGQSFGVSLAVVNDNPVYSLLLTVNYDSSVVTINSVSAAGPVQGSNCNLLTNLNPPGQAKIGIYCAQPLNAGANTVAAVNFSVNNLSNTSNVTSYLNLTATFDEIAQAAQQNYPGFLTITPQTFTITASAGSNGSVSPSGAVAVTLGSSQAFTITPNNGYQADQVLVDGNPVTLSDGTYTFQGVTAAHTLSVSFVPISFALSVSAGLHGSISPSGNVTVDYGANQTFTVTPNAGYSVQLTVDGNTVTLANNTYTLKKVTGAHAIAASFTQLTYVLTATPGADGSMIPSGNITVDYGANQTFTLTPNTGYAAQLTVDGRHVTLTNDTYTLSHVTAAHTLVASFTQPPPQVRESQTGMPASATGQNRPNANYSEPMAAVSGGTVHSDDFVYPNNAQDSGIIDNSSQENAENGN